MTVDYQLAIGGLTLGDGTPYTLPKGVAGLGLPELRTSDTPRPQDHGLFWGNDYFGKRTMTLEMTILADDADGVVALMDALAAVWQPPAPADTDAVVPLTVDIPGRVPRRLDGRPRRAAYNLAELEAGVITAALQYDVADPRWYDAAETVLTIGLPIATGGLVWPIVWPISWGTATSGTAVADNAGNFETRPTVRFNGPLTGPTIENVTAGRTFRFRSDFTIAAGEFVDVDFDALTVLLAGTASRYSDLAPNSQWWVLAPGINEIRLGGIAGTGNAELRYRSAWL